MVQDDDELLVGRSEPDSVGLGFGSGVGSDKGLYVGLSLGPIVIERNDIEKPGGPGGPPGLGGGYTPGPGGRPTITVPLDPGGQNQHSGHGPRTG